MNDPRLTIVLTVDQADALTELLRCAKTICPEPPPVARRGDKPLDQEYRTQRWFARMQPHNINLNALAESIEKAMASGAIAEVERTICGHPVVYGGKCLRCRREP